MNNWVYALAVSGTNLYAGGSFTTAGEVAANCIAQWNGSNWSALGSGIDGNTAYGPVIVYALAVSGTNLYAGGNFTTAGGLPANGIAQWNGSRWSALGPGMGTNFPWVQALAVSGTNLYAGGTFTAAGGGAADTIAQWNGSSWSALGSLMPFLPVGENDPLVQCLAVWGTNLYAGGYFTTASLFRANNIAEWNGSSWLPLAWGMGGDYPYVHTLAVMGTNLYVGGAFTTAGTNVSPYIAAADLTPQFPPIEPGDLFIGRSPDGNVQLTFWPPFFFCGSIIASTNLSAWIVLTNYCAGTSAMVFEDTESTNYPHRFYQPAW